MSPTVAALLSVLLIILSAFFVAAEYTLVASRRSRVEALASKGSRSAKMLLRALGETPRYVAATQVGITICGLAMGSLTEPLVSHQLVRLIGPVLPKSVTFILSLIIVTFTLVVIGELAPKYISLKFPERLALYLIGTLRFVALLLTPIAAVAQALASWLVKPLGIEVSALSDTSISREELAMLVRTADTEGMLEETHANVVSKALRFDKLDAADIMIHRLDIKWIDVGLNYAEALEACGKIPHSRILVCRGDVDDTAGVLYLYDLIRADPNDFDLEKLARPVELVPENLTLNKLVNRMREVRTQLVLVVDEYGGTSGLITLEDVVEEVFGEMEDQLESERPPIERVASNRLSARSDVRYDELLDFLDFEPDTEVSTDTLATLVINTLERMPKLGDSVEIEIGTLMVENMARQRITRVRVMISPEIAERSQ
ncbi:MAG: HlyC/CorC family transporter [Chthonomonas sp.]|nr:HlyC/CorC family transporter [Chthonomonas sp.]